MDAALVAATTSLGLSVANAIIDYAGRARLARRQDQLDASRGERDAWRDYRYEARKRLYVDLQPVVFQLAERCETAQLRITKTIAGAARASNLTQPGRLGTGWENDPSHMATTLWALFSPVALVRLERRRLTGLDLSVDQGMRWHHALAVLLHDLWLAGEELGAIQPAVAHDAEHPLTRQYLLAGSLERVIDEIVPDADHAGPRLLSFTEMYDQFVSKDRGPGLDRAALLLTDFHPRNKPVLWRILIAKAHVHAAIVETFRAGLDDGGAGEATSIQGRCVHPLDAEATADWRTFDWRSPGRGESDEEVRADVEAARTYLNAKLPRQRPA